STRKPDSLDYIGLVRASFRTWLLDKAQSFYPHAPFVQSDLLPDYQASEPIYVFQGTDHLRANYRRLAPMYYQGYPQPGDLPTPDHADSIPPRLFEESYSLNRRLAEEWSRRFDAESQSSSILFYQRCLKLAPYETTIYRNLARLLMDNGDYAWTLALVRDLPDTSEGLERSDMQQLGVLAALQLGDAKLALDLASQAAQTWQETALARKAYVLEILGLHDECLELRQDKDERYDSDSSLFYFIRHHPEQAEKKAAELFSWLEQFEDLEKASEAERFSFNEFKAHPYYYAAMDRWDKALWLLLPLAEAVQNDYIWFMLMTTGQKMQDQNAVNLAQHVLATHVHNCYGDFARFMRKEQTWEHVLNTARVEEKPQPIYFLASVLAEQRGDKPLAIRLLKQVMNPRFGTGAWFTCAWNGLKKLDIDPYAFARRTLKTQGQEPSVDVEK
ncbi:MAG: hypothetical protein KJ626_03195, partial [Verrucomicrobia bacterium]|nr:hypothetical protein [Verrucomicrobiota bacterium]